MPVPICVFPALGTQGPCEMVGSCHFCCSSQALVQPSLQNRPPAAPFVTVTDQPTSQGPSIESPLNKPQSSLVLITTQPLGSGQTPIRKKQDSDTVETTNTNKEQTDVQTPCVRAIFFFPAMLTRCPHLPRGYMGSARRTGKATGSSTPFCGNQKQKACKYTLVYIQVF